jgi:hypothetical protein
MKIFLFSRRFLVPFFLTWILHLGFAEWKMWRLYKDDFAGKGLPGSLKTEWLLRQASGNLLLLSFLLALLIGTTYYAHQYLKRNSEHRSLFSGKNLLVIVLLGLTGFYYTSFLQPGSEMKSRMLLADIVYASSKETFQRTTEAMYKTREMMTLPELYHARDSIAGTAVSHPEYLTPGGNNPKQHELRMYDFKIMEKIAFPFAVVLFYCIGILAGISFRKTIGLVPLLISYFLVFTGWYYAQSWMKLWFNQEKTNAFIANFGILLLLFVVAICLFLLLKKYGFYKSRPDELSLEFTPEAE